MAGTLLAQKTADHGDNNLDSTLRDLRRRMRHRATHASQISSRAIKVSYCDRADAVRAVLTLAHDESWSVGVRLQAVGPPDDTGAVDLDLLRRASAHPSRTAMHVHPPEDRAVREAALALAVATVRRWSDPGLQVALLSLDGATQTRIAERLGVSRQAVGQRMKAASWQQCREVLLRTLEPDFSPAPADPRRDVALPREH